MKACGTHGELRVGYQPAATLGEWSLDVVPAPPVRSFSVVAQVRATNAYWVLQRPITLVLCFGRFRWVWTEVTPAFENGRVSMRVTGKPEIVKE